MSAGEFEEIDLRAQAQAQATARRWCPFARSVEFFDPDQASGRGSGPVATNRLMGSAGAPTWHRACDCIRERCAVWVTHSGGGRCGLMP